MVPELCFPSRTFYCGIHALKRSHLANDHQLRNQYQLMIYRCICRVTLEIFVESKLTTAKIPQDFTRIYISFSLYVVGNQHHQIWLSSTASLFALATRELLTQNLVYSLKDDEMPSMHRKIDKWTTRTILQKDNLSLSKKNMPNKQQQKTKMCRITLHQRTKWSTQETLGN